MKRLFFELNAKFSELILQKVSSKAFDSDIGYIIEIPKKILRNVFIFNI